MEGLGGVRGEAARLVSEVGREREAVMSMQCMCVCVQVMATLQHRRHPLKFRTLER